jgi:biopolymer transport protein ExbD
VSRIDDAFDEIERGHKRRMRRIDIMGVVGTILMLLAIFVAGFL